MLLAAALVLGVAFVSQSRVRKMQVTVRDQETFTYQWFIYSLGEVDEISVRPIEDDNNANEVESTDEKHVNQLSPRISTPDWESLKFYDDEAEVKALEIKDKRVEFHFCDEYLGLQIANATTGTYEDDVEMPYDSFSRIVLDSGMGGITGVESFAKDKSVMYDKSTEELIIVSSADASNVRVYDIQGRCVRDVAASGSDEMRVSLRGLGSGIYVAAVVSENGVFTSKIAKK